MTLGTVRSRADSLRWMAQGTAIFLDALATVSDEELARPSRLPGWTRRHLVAHLAGNAEGLLNLTHWARTGEETPMYASAEQRAVDIEAGATRPATELREWAARAGETLGVRLADLDERQWRRQVRTTRGGAISAERIPWLRAREVMIHAVDLGAEVEFDDLPVDFLAALVGDVVAERADGGPAAVLTATDLSRADLDESWTLSGTGDPTPVTGTVAGLAAYLTGRGADGVRGPGGAPAPDLARWL